MFPPAAGHRPSVPDGCCPQQSADHPGTAPDRGSALFGLASSFRHGVRSLRFKICLCVARRQVGPFAIALRLADHDPLGPGSSSPQAVFFSVRFRTHPFCPALKTHVMCPRWRSNAAGPMGIPAVEPSPSNALRCPIRFPHRPAHWIFSPVRQRLPGRPTSKTVPRPDAGFGSTADSQHRSLGSGLGAIPAAANSRRGGWPARHRFGRRFLPPAAVVQRRLGPWPRVGRVAAVVSVIAPGWRGTSRWLSGQFRITALGQPASASFGKGPLRPARRPHSHATAAPPTSRRITHGRPVRRRWAMAACVGSDPDHAQAGEEKPLKDGGHGRGVTTCRERKRVPAGFANTP